MTVRGDEIKFSNDNSWWMESNIPTIKSRKEFEAIKNNKGKIQFRCKECNKLLANSNKDGKIEAEIKCVRCGMINER
jgi:uncharacterized C2H2 Zn-finger protein